MATSTLLMAFTGTVLKYPRITNFIPLDLVFIRNLHNIASPFFGVVLVLMMVSGVVMYFYPIIARRKKTNVK
jgi:ABC-type transport system involved in cytochrome c biogenesis permease subunit